MACCALGAALTAVVVWAIRVVRGRLLRRPPASDPAAWRLPG